MAIKQGRVAFHTELMSAEDMRHSICLEEFVDHSRSKRVPCASVRHSDEEKEAAGHRPFEDNPPATD